MISLFLILISLLPGLMICHLFFSQAKTINLRFFINLALPISMGISSAIFILFNLLGLSIFVIGLVEILLTLFLYLKIKNSSKLSFQFEWLSINKLLLTPILLIAIVFYFYSWILDAGIFFFDSIQSPHGLWDAWSCWNLIAKFITRAPYEWPQLLHQMNAVDFHPDYPLLQKGFISHCWLLLENESVWVPIIFAFVFTFCTIGLLSASVSIFTNKTAGLIAGLVLLCTPFFMVMGYSQYADNTVGFFYFATIVLLTLARSGIEIKPHFLIAAGITAGLSTWSKNEGLLFIVCLFISQLTRLFLKNYRDLLAELKYLFLGMLPILLLVAYLKIIIAPTNQIMSAQGTTTFIKLTDYSRYTQAGAWFWNQFKSFGFWEFNPWWFFLAGVLIKGISIKENSYSFISNFTLILLMLTGFFLVEIITPLDLTYYLSTSVHRLLFQLFPSFIFIYFLAINGKKSNYFYSFFKKKILK